MAMCPVCRSTRVYASHRRGFLERIPLTWAGVLPFRCSQCQSRFYRPFLWRRRRGQWWNGGAEAPPDRPPRWPIQVRADVVGAPPGREARPVGGTTENMSLQGAQIRLPLALPAGSEVEIRFPGEPSRPGIVRWSSGQDSPGTLHGVQFQVPLGRRTRHATPFRRLLWRQRMRRVVIGVLALVCMAGATYGLVWMVEMLRVYDPQYYEPKDIERQRHEQAVPAPRR